MNLNVLVLPGDGVGPEVISAATHALEAVALRFGHRLAVTRDLIGGAAIVEEGVPLPARTLRRARQAGAVLLGAVGLPRFDGNPPEERPEKGLLDLRSALGVFANLRPVAALPSLAGRSPLRQEVVQGADLVIVRELTSGLYYGEPRGISGTGPETRAVNTMTCTRAEVERVARLAFRLATRRRNRVTSVDKANVLENSQLWRTVVEEVASDFPSVALEHMYVDNCAMQLILDPRRFDVLLTENLFGDILSDEAAVLAGSIGMLPSVSVGERRPSGTRMGLYEPVHGSAPDIAGSGAANPLGAILSVAAMLEHSFGLVAEAKAVEAAVRTVVERGVLTPDLACDRGRSTSEVGEAVAAAVSRPQ